MKYRNVLILIKSLAKWNEFHVMLNSCPAVVTTVGLYYYVLKVVREMLEPVVIIFNFLLVKQ